MLKNPNRLKRDKDFDRVFEGKQGVFDDVCGIKYGKNGRNVSRFAVVVGIKVSKSAVVRNKIRRQYREIIRLNLDKIVPGYDVILLTSKKAIAMSYKDKEARIGGVFSRAKLLK